MITTGGRARGGFGGAGGPRPGSDPANAQTDRERDVEDGFVQSLIQKGYKLASRTDIQDVAKEQKFQKSGLTEDNAVAAGKILNVSAVLLVDIPDFAAEAVGMSGRNTPRAARAAVGARLIDVAMGKLLWAHVDYRPGQAATEGDANDLLKSVAKDVASFVPPYPPTPDEWLARAERLELLGQTSAALHWYKLLVSEQATTPAGKKAAARIKALGGR